MTFREDESTVEHMKTRLTLITLTAMSCSGLVILFEALTAVKA